MVTQPTTFVRRFPPYHVSNNAKSSPVVLGLVERGARLAAARVPHLATRERLGERVHPAAAAAVVGVFEADDLLAERVELARVVHAHVKLAGVVVELRGEGEAIH